MISNTFNFLTLKNRPIRWRTLYKTTGKIIVLYMQHMINDTKHILKPR